MSTPLSSTSARSLTSEVKEMKMEDDYNTSGLLLRDSRSSSVKMAEKPPHSHSADSSTSQRKPSTMSESTLKTADNSPSPAVKSDTEVETIGGDVTVTLEPGKAPKLSRKASQKVISKPPATFSHLDDATAEATSTFEVMRDCHYQHKQLGNTEHALECDCSEEWDSKAKMNMACGEDTDCINRATKMECPGDCGCGADCQNQRFQQKRYADVSVIKTDKKGFGLRANADLKPNEFIFEYIGEVITEAAFRKRMIAYDEEGIKHFYFMSLSKSEFVDATKKGNLGRFCNHSCNPNCYVDKWVVGEKLRMGIFAERHIRSGEELVFNYNVDRYGADPQPCYCNEPNCSGFIGGKTQTGTDSGIQLSGSLQQALGLTSNDGWSEATSHKPKRKKKASEDDEEYIDSVELSELDHVSVMPLIAELYKNQEKWVVVKLLQRIQKSRDPRVLTRVGALHGYTVMQKLLKQHGEDSNVVLQVFDVLDKIPKMSKNKIEDAGIEKTVGDIIATAEDQRVKDGGAELLNAWSKLERTYRIPKRERDPNAAPAERRNERPERRERNRSRSRSRSRSKSVEPIKAPSGPRNTHAQRPFNNGPRPQFRRPPPGGPLPPGWFEAKAQNGTTYYYNTSGATTWSRPTLPAHNAPPPPPPKAVTESQSIQSIIDNIVSSQKIQATPEPARNGAISTSATPAETPKREKKREPWRDWPIEKQKKMYANTLHAHGKPVMAKFNGKLDKAEYKRIAKEITNNLVEDHFQRKFVQDPGEIMEERKDKVAKLYKRFFERALVKQKEREKRNASSVAQSGGSSTPAGTPSTQVPALANGVPKSQDDDAMDLSDNEGEDESAPIVVSDTALTTAPLKRRHEGADHNGEMYAEDATSKRLRTEEEEEAQAPSVPPPPPPPQSAGSMDVTMLSDETDANGVATEPTKARNGEHGPGFTIKGVAGSSTKEGQSPTQIATPPTTGSPDGGERVKQQQAAEYSGMNPDRLRRLSEADH